MTQTKATPNGHRTSELLRRGIGRGKAHITLQDFLQTFKHRAFGFLLLLLTLPNFIPFPIGGVMGPLIALIGAQMLFGLEQPWLPAWLGKKQVSRIALRRFTRRMGPLLRWIERISRPRWFNLTTAWANHFNGALLIGLGLALSLPIPFTNYLFGVILLTFSMALIERDGILLTVVWLAGAAALATLFGLGGWIIQFTRDFFG